MMKSTIHYSNVIDKKPQPLEEYRKFINKVCNKCGAVVEEAKLHHYNHDKGYWVEGIEHKQWIYVTCPGCNYKIALWKVSLDLRIMSSEEKNEWVYRYVVKAHKYPNGQAFLDRKNHKGTMDLEMRVKSELMLFVQDSYYNPKVPQLVSLWEELNKRIMDPEKYFLDEEDESRYV